MHEFSEPQTLKESVEQDTAREMRDGKLISLVFLANESREETFAREYGTLLGIARKYDVKTFKVDLVDSIVTVDVK